MPSRRDVFVNGNIYHIFNKTIDEKPIFKAEIIASRWLSLLLYYRSRKADIRYSRFIRLSDSIREQKMGKILDEKYFKVEILCYCLMPNHFHLLIKQKYDKGIISFVSDVVNSTTRFYNQLHTREGPIFLPQFRSRRIVNREVLIHVSRYIHLNPYSSSLVESFTELENYPYSSFKEYVSKNDGISNSKVILDEFDGKRENYRKFVMNNAEYQKMIELTKYKDKWI